MCSVDPLSTLLDSGERVADVRLRPPWAVALDASTRPAMVAVAEGEAWFHPEDDAPLHLQTGDLVLLRSQGRRLFSHAAVRPPLPPASVDGPSTRGEKGPGGTRLFIRFFRAVEGPSSDVFPAMAPEQVLVTARDHPLWHDLRDEADHLSMARSSVLSRLLDLVFIDAMRRWVAEGDAQGWMRAVLDPMVGAALHLFHEKPEHPWTLQEIADRVGVNRSSLARRFQLFVGEPPMTYLRRWRLTRAATLLAEGASVTSAARTSGFGDPFAFSGAFYGRYGVSPGRYRDAGASVGSA